MGDTTERERRAFRQAEDRGPYAAPEGVAALHYLNGKQVTPRSRKPATASDQNILGHRG